jgi:hypothetical protein
MIGIYQDSFLKYLQDNLGSVPKITGKNIIIKCPYCEYNKIKDHYHMHISLEAPMFHCFSGECHEHGGIPKLLRKISGNDISEKFIDKNEIKKLTQNAIKVTKYKHIQKEIKLPEIDEDKYKLKSLYLKKRFRFNQADLSSIKGLVFDVDEFLNINDVPIDPKLFKVRDYLQTNFVGFLTEHQSTIVFRNIDSESDFRYYKISLSNPMFSDYYKLHGGDYNSNIVVLGEGIFDIMLEHIFDSTELRNKSKLYAAGLSTFYGSLCKSLVFNENIFRQDVHILSDNGINLEYYKKRGKDFADVPVDIEKFII